MNKFNLEKQWKLYLERVDLKEENLHPIQLQETKRAFMGAMGQMLMICIDDLDSFKNPVTGEAVVYMIDQVSMFFQNEIKKEGISLPENIEELIDKMLQDVFRKDWMDSEDWKGFLNMFERKEPDFIGKIKQDILIGIQKGYSLTHQIAIVKSLLMKQKKP